jgi:hypothetical protein
MMTSPPKETQDSWQVLYLLFFVFNTCALDQIKFLILTFLGLGIILLGQNVHLLVLRYHVIARK